MLGEHRPPPMNAICGSVCTKTEWVLNGAILKVLFKIQHMGIAFDLWHVTGDVIAFDLWPGDVIPMSDVIAFDLGLVVFGSWTQTAGSVPGRALWWPNAQSHVHYNHQEPRNGSWTRPVIRIGSKI